MDNETAERSCMTLDLFDLPRSLNRDEWLDRARDIARRLAEENGEVCADEIHERLPIPQGIDGRIMGSVFEGMRHVGFQKSKRKTCHHRIISRFTIAREAECL